MASTLQQESDGINLTLSTDVAMELSRQIAQVWKTVMDKGTDNVVLLCDSRLRCPLAGMLSRTVPLLPVVAYDEIVLGTDVEPLQTVSLTNSESKAQNEHELVGVSR
jgi:flagellar biosynthesis component FlhA